MSPDKEARAAALRAQLKAVAPDMLDFMEMAKNGFDAKVVFVEAPGIKMGKEPEAGVVPNIPLPADTWDYEVGKTAKKGKR